MNEVFFKKKTEKKTEILKSTGIEAELGDNIMYPVSKFGHFLRFFKRSLLHWFVK